MLNLINDSFLFYCDVCCRYHSIDFVEIPERGIAVDDVINCIRSVEIACGRVKKQTIVSACMGNQQTKLHLRYLRFVESTGNDYLDLLQDYIEYRDRWQFIMREWIGSIHKLTGLRLLKIRRYNTKKERWILPRYLERKIPEHVLNFLDIVNVGSHWVCASFRTVEDLKMCATEVYWQPSNPYEAKGYVDIKDPEIVLERTIIAAKLRIKELKQNYEK